MPSHNLYLYCYFLHACTFCAHTYYFLPPTIPLLSSSYTPPFPPSPCLFYLLFSSPYSFFLSMPGFFSPSCTHFPLCYIYSHISTTITIPFSKTIWSSPVLNFRARSCTCRRTRLCCMLILRRDAVFVEHGNPLPGTTSQFPAIPVTSQTYLFLLWLGLVDYLSVTLKVGAHATAHDQPLILVLTF